MTITTATKKIDLMGHEVELDALVRLFNTDLSEGLTKEQVEKKQATYGSNIIPKAKQSLFQLYLSPILNVLINVYLIMTGILLILAIIDQSILSQAFQWLVFIAFNVVIAIVQQYRATQKLEALHKLSAPEARVIRDGMIDTVPSTELVPGDLIELTQGDRIPADIRLISSTNLLVNEASLTGESVAVPKIEDGYIVLEPDTPLSERNNMVYVGTFVETGTAIGIVVHTAGNTEIGKLSSELEALNTGEIPLRNKVNTLGKYLVVGSMFLLISTLSYRMLTLINQQRLDVDILVTEIASAVITAMSIMPINIPLLTTVVLITGVLAMAKYRVIVRDLSGIESLGRCSVLCSDKTGTITRSQMTVKRIWDGVSDSLYGVTGLGYAPSGIIYPTKNKAASEIDETYVPDSLNVISGNPALKLMLISGMLNNNAELIVQDVFEPEEGQTSWKAVGSPTDASILALFAKSHLNKRKTKEQFKELRVYPFDSAYKRMSRIYEHEEYGMIMFTKGALEVLLPRCSKIGYPGKEKKLTDDLRERIQTYSNEFAALGFRIITMTYKTMNQLPPKHENVGEEREIVEQDLTYIGFFCLLDPPRAGVKESVKEVKRAGVEPIMITGDSPVTAGTIARKIGILTAEESVHEGREIKALSDQEFKNTKVFARVSPQDKQIIVERYQAEDKVVAMTGDGVNDSLALSMADAGISMGITGTDVAKQASDIVIADDSFNSIVTGIKLGRNLFEKIRLMIFFYICVNLAEGSVYFLTSFIPNFFLFDTWQRIYLFSTIHTFPPLALIFDRIFSDVMEKRPRDSAEIFSRRLVVILVLTSVSLAFMALLIYFATYYSVIPVVNENLMGIIPPITPPDPDGIVTTFDAISMQQAKARTMLHTFYFISEALLVLSIRRMDKSILSSIKEDSFWFVYVAVFVIPIMHVMLMYIPTLQYILATFGINFYIISLSIIDWVICLGLGLIPILVIELIKYYVRSQNESF